MFPTDVIVHPPEWLSKPRDDWPPRLIEIHSTRSGQSGPNWTMATEFGACKNWFESTSNQAKDQNGNLLGYGACASNIIGGDGTLGIVLPDNRRPTWGAGFGWLGTWAIDWYAVSFEVCQATIYTPFTEAQYDRLAFECWKRHVLYGIPMVFLPYLTQTENPVPAGLTRHDNCANGRAYGKSDPGPLFDEAKLLARIDYWRGQEEGMTDADRAWVIQFSGGIKLIKGGAPTVYVVDHRGKRPFPGGPTEFVKVGFDWDDVIRLPDTVIGAIPNAQM